MSSPLHLIRFLGLLAVWSTAACSNVYDLGLQGPVEPLAVSASATYVLQYSIFFKCTSDRVLRCGNGNYNQITKTTAVSVDDPSRLQASLAANGDILVRALAEGTAKLTASGIDLKGETQTESRTFSILPVQSAIANLPGSCLTVPDAKTLTVPLGSDIPLDLTVRNGTTALHATGWMPTIDPGSLTLVSGTYPFAFKAPLTPGDTQIQIPLQQPFSLPVHVYDPTKIDGISLSARRMGPYIPNTDYVIDVALSSAGKTICQESMPSPTRSVAILTPDMCVFWTGYGGSVMILPSPQEGVDLRTVTVQLLSKPGVCRLQAAIKGTAYTATLDLPSSVK